MSERLTLRLRENQQIKPVFRAAYDKACELVAMGQALVLVLRPETRSEAQNRLMWPILTCFAKQRQWPINGELVYMEPEDWKDVLTAAFKGETVRVADGLNGGKVMLGQRTSKFSKKQFAEWIEFLYATAAARAIELPAWTWDGWDG